MSNPTTIPSPARRPVVLVPACSRMIGNHEYYVAGHKYVEAVRLAGCVPMVVPSAQPHELTELLDMADGILLTGSPSNVHPSHFGEAVLNPALPLDPERDAWTLPLVPMALELGIPLMAICRGFQEANVSLGGSLYQAVQTVPGRNDHREPNTRDLEVEYGFAHEVSVVPGGLLEKLIERPSFQVNSLHGQGVNRLADGLRVEATAPDGLVEAVSFIDAKAFALAVQWHPEWQAERNPVSMRMFSAFGRACALRRERRLHPDGQRDPDT